MVIATAGLVGSAHSAVIPDPPLADGPGDCIDPIHGENADLIFGTSPTTLEARSDLRVLQDFTGFSAGRDNIVGFSDNSLPDIRFEFSGSFSPVHAGSATTDPMAGTSPGSAMLHKNSATGTSTLTISFGTWDGSAFTDNHTVKAAAFALTHLQTSKSVTVTFRDSTGKALPKATFEYSGLTDADGDSKGNHGDIYFGWDSPAQSTAEIGSITVEFTDGGIPEASGFDDLAFTSLKDGIRDQAGQATKPIFIDDFNNGNPADADSAARFWAVNNSVTPGNLNAMRESGGKLSLTVGTSTPSPDGFSGMSLASAPSSSFNFFTRPLTFQVRGLSMAGTTAAGKSTFRLGLISGHNNSYGADDAVVLMVYGNGKIALGSKFNTASANEKWIFSQENGADDIVTGFDLTLGPAPGGGIQYGISVHGGNTVKRTGLIPNISAAAWGTGGNSALMLWAQEYYATGIEHFTTQIDSLAVIPGSSAIHARPNP